MGAGDDCEFRRRGLRGLRRLRRLRPIGALLKGGIRLRVCGVRLFHCARKDVLYEIYITRIVLQNFDTHAVFYGHDRRIDGTSYSSLQFYLYGVREVYHDIEQGILRKGMLRPDEKSAHGKVAGYPSIVLVPRGKLGFKPSDKPVVSASWPQNCSCTMMSSSLFCPVDMIAAFTPTSSSIFRIYDWACTGNFPNSVIPSVLFFQPLNFS